MCLQIHRLPVWDAITQNPIILLSDVLYGPVCDDKGHQHGSPYDQCSEGAEERGGLFLLF